MLPCDVGSNRGCRAASATANQVGQRCRMAAIQPWRQLLRFTDAPLLAAQRPVPPCPCPEPARAATRLTPARPRSLTTSRPRPRMRWCVLSAFSVIGTR
jgi:hypothetical protein